MKVLRYLDYNDYGCLNLFIVDDVISSDLTYSNLTISTSCTGTDSTICAIPDDNSGSQNICLVSRNA